MRDAQRTDWDNNLYNNPEKFGLEIVDGIDYAGSYEFEMRVIFRVKESGELLMGSDSGCSCPSPFESHELFDLLPINFRELREEAVDYLIGKRGWSGSNRSGITAWLEKLSELEKEAK